MMAQSYISPEIELSEFAKIILDNSTEGILLTDSTGLAIATNRKFCELFQISVTDLLGINVLDLVKQGLWSPNLFQRVAQKRKPLSVIQTTKSGNSILATGTPIFDDKRRLRYVLFNDRDMSLQSVLEGDSHKAVELTIHAGTKYEESIPETQQYTLSGIVTKNKLMKSKLNLALQVAKFPVPVLLTGESGVGKSMYARFIHDQSPRREGPFIAINCGAIPEQLVESELFGHTGGAFTGASAKGKKGRVQAAHNGTLFLDEISELPYPLQVKLLQFLETSQIYPVGGTDPIPVDCTVIAATNKNLAEMMAEKKFRDDLFFRLNGIPIELPPLRKRPEDIPPLARFFLEQYATRFGIAASLTPEALQELAKYRYYGNVRELSFLIQRLIIVTGGGQIDAEHVQQWVTDEIPAGSTSYPSYFGNLSQQVAQFERDLIKKTIAEYGNQVEAARVLGVHQSTLSRKLHGMQNCNTNA